MRGANESFHREEKKLEQDFLFSFSLPPRSRKETIELRRLGSFSNDDAGDGSENVTIKVNSRFRRRRSC